MHEYLKKKFKKNTVQTTTLCFLSGSNPIKLPHFVWFPPQTASWHEMLLDALQNLDNVLVNLALTWNVGDTGWILSNSFFIAAHWPVPHPTEKTEPCYWLSSHSSFFSDILFRFVLSWTLSNSLLKAYPCVYHPLGLCTLRWVRWLLQSVQDTRLSVSSGMYGLLLTVQWFRQKCISW